MIYVFQDIYCLCSNFPVDFVRFCRPQRRTAVSWPRGLQQCTWVGRLLPQSAPKMAAKAAKTIYLCVSTLTLSLQLLSGAFYSVFVVDTSIVPYTSVYCRIQAYRSLSMTKWVSFNNASAITAPILYIGVVRPAALCDHAQYWSRHFIFSNQIFYYFLYFTIV